MPVAARGDGVQHASSSRCRKPVLEETWSNYQPQTRRPYGVMEWPALLRKLDRIDPSYRN